MASTTALVGAAITLAPAASAQDFPAGPVTIIVPLAPGGGVDAITRIVADDLGKAWSTTVLVENMLGGSGMIAGQALTRSAPDGQTLMLASAGELAVNTTLLADTLSYDVAKDFQTVALAAKIPNVFVVGAYGPCQSVATVIAAARADPGAVTYGSSGIGNPQHLTGALLGYRAGVEFSHVPYKGSSQQATEAPCALLSDENFFPHHRLATKPHRGRPALDLDAFVGTVVRCVMKIGMADSSPDRPIEGPSSELRPIFQDASPFSWLTTVPNVAFGL